MIQFLNPLLFGGLFAISAPIIIHLLHRRKIKQVNWGAMRFVLELMAKRRRRIFLEDLVLHPTGAFATGGSSRRDQD